MPKIIIISLFFTFLLTTVPATSFTILPSELSQSIEFGAADIKTVKPKIKTPTIKPQKVEPQEVKPNTILEPPITLDPDNIYRRFTSQGFKDFQDAFGFPGAQTRTVVPYIRNHAGADARIRMIAENRGYRLKPEGWSFKSETSDWANKLRSAGLNDGVDIRVTSGYRSVTDQRYIFNRQLGYSYTNSQIAAGYADTAINNVLKYYSIPGYSKHHTGYTVDFNCSGGRLNQFKYSNCYTWISANNFYNAKRFGFVPSYPEGVSNQGPVPEPWEFVWVGKENLKNRIAQPVVLF